MKADVHSIIQWGFTGSNNTGWMFFGRTDAKAETPVLSAGKIPWMEELELTQTLVHRVSDAIQPSHPLASPSSPAPNPSHLKVRSVRKS